MPPRQNVCLHHRHLLCYLLARYTIQFQFCNSLYTYIVLYIVNRFRSLNLTFYFIITRLLIDLSDLENLLSNAH